MLNENEKLFPYPESREDLLFEVGAFDMREVKKENTSTKIAEYIADGLMHKSAFRMRKH